MAETAVIIVAGGAGRRMGGALPKQFMILGNEPILARSINRIREALPAAEIIVVLPEEHISLWENLASRFDVAAHKTVAGGAERFYSVRNGLQAVSDDVRYIAVHDAVRPLVSKQLIIKLILAAETASAVIPVTVPTDSCRMTDADGSHIIDRNMLRMVQTPQVFHADILRNAYTQPYSASFTDDASVVEAAGTAITLCEGEARNIKITRPSDLTIAEAIIAATEDGTQF